MGVPCCAVVPTLGSRGALGVKRGQARKVILEVPFELRVEVFRPIQGAPTKELRMLVRCAVVVIGRIAKIRQGFEIAVYELIDYFIFELEPMPKGMGYNPQRRKPVMEVYPKPLADRLSCLVLKELLFDFVQVVVEHIAGEKNSRRLAPAQDR